MSFRRIQLVSAVALLGLGVMGYYVYSAFAVQGVGTLAQAPLNIEANIKPAFLMGVDNSGSMSSDETLCRTAEGRCFWNNTTRSFFDANGVALESGTQYSKVVDDGAPRPDHYGAARDPEYNRAYFNPAVDYKPWQMANGSFETDSPVTAAVEDVRNGGTTFDFTKPLQSTFTFTAGMVLYEGTRYNNNNKCSNSPVPGTGNATNNWITLTSDITFPAGSNCSVTFEYYPAVVYLSTTATPPVGYDLTKRVLIKAAGPKGADLYKYVYLASNFTTGGTAAAQNFANWWTYHGNRNRAMIAGMTQSMADVKDMRVGYFKINPAPPSGNVTMYDMNTDKASLYTQMRSLDASGNTPLRRAVRYMGDQFRRTDAGAPVQLSCQKNAAMLFTDGYTNDNNSGLVTTGVDNQDGGLGTPFADNQSNTIADLAMWSYKNNIRPDMGLGNVPVPDQCAGANPDPRLDCNRNQHVNFYGVTLGARGAVYDVNAAATADPYANPPAWGATGTMNLNPANVDDIWHAALNTRGEYINAQSPTAIVDAMRRILASVGSGNTPSGSIGLTGSRIGAGSFTVVPRYTSANNSTDWFSTLSGQSAASDPLTNVVTFTSLWEVTDPGKIPAAAARNIVFGKTNGAVKPAAAVFNASNVSAADLCVDSLKRCTATGASDGITGVTSKLKVTLAQAIDYLRGDQSLETSTTTPLRKRTTRLGDIVGSSPLVTSPILDYGYRSVRDLQANGTFTYPYATSYATHMSAKKTADKPMVYVGANDGMLHAFDGKTGVELFAYAPATAVGHMGNLLFPYNILDKNAQVFKHTYYVDGPSTVSDAYIGSSWKTVLVGTAGAGGRGVFGLDVTTPVSFGPSNVLWEVNDQVTALDSSGVPVRNNIGYVLGKPVIVPVKVGSVVSWKAIFGNGYNSINQDAVLFVVDVATGAVTKIKAEESARAAITNGLGNLIAVDRFVGSTTTSGRDGYADTVYAGDQNGAVWKFDLRNNTVPAAPLFVATDGTGARQPVMGGFEAASGPNGGVMLYFGTGSFSFENDKTDKQIQTLYGVLDNGVAISGRSALQQQTASADVGINRTVSTNVLTAGKLGWYLDLGITTSGTVAATGERSVGYPRIEGGVVFFPSYAPLSTGSCSGEGLNRIYGLNALSGGAALSQVSVGSPTGPKPGTATGAITLDTGGSAPVKDVAVMSNPRVQPLTCVPGSPGCTEVAPPPGTRCTMLVQVAGAPPMYIPRPCGRQSWRQVR